MSTQDPRPAPRPGSSPALNADPEGEFVDKDVPRGDVTGDTPDGDYTDKDVSGATTEEVPGEYVDSDVVGDGRDTPPAGSYTQKDA